ncbi:MAG TPA: septum site-determining protein MinC [Candidatus Binatia bacterium]|nr:septum site-determining protein MinC [Candidatus Binatia bacterium]
MEASQSTAIRVKGIREGILLGLDDQAAPFAELLLTLQEELAQKQAFLKGSRIVLDVGQRRLQRGELAELQTLLTQNEMELWTVLAEAETTREAARELGLATRLAGSNTDLDGNELRATGQSRDPDPVAEAAGEANALLVLETLRSGQSIYHEGHVTIVGDVNPGAQVIAGGHVVVWGRLRGMVHAGALGDASTVICALELAPTQLRIAGHIAIAPEGQQQATFPEMASVRDGNIVAEPWRVRE